MNSSGGVSDGGVGGILETTEYQGVRKDSVTVAATKLEQNQFKNNETT